LKTVAQALEKVSPKESVESISFGLKENNLGITKSYDVSSSIEGSSRSIGGVGSAEIKELVQGHFDLPLREARRYIRKAYFEYHLKLTGGSMTRVSEQTGLERTHLYRKLKALGIDVRKIGRHST
jgi:DNA-binding NtrC family response regulator